MSPWDELLREDLETLPSPVSPAQFARLTTYLALLDRWNRAMNLTSLEPGSRVRRLVTEPLWVASQLEPRGRYLDIGSGNGSPAVPWHLARGFGRMDLLEPRSRRSAFLEFVVRKLALPHTRVLRMRFDALSAGDQPPPEWISLQGVRLDASLMRQIRALCPDARVVWLSRNAVPPERPEMRLGIPASDREALVFRVHTQ